MILLPLSSFSGRVVLSGLVGSALVFAACSSDAEDGAGTGGGSGVGTGGGSGNGGSAGMPKGGASSGGNGGVGGGSGGAGGAGGTPSAGGSSSGGRGGNSTTTGGESGGGTGGSSGTGGSGGSGGTPAVAPDCTVFLDAAASLANVRDAVNGAAAGDVICLARGATWNERLAISNEAPTADNRVTLCAADADGQQCSGTGAPNPRIQGIDFTPVSDGFILRNLDVYCGDGCDASVGLDFRDTSHIRIEGGVISGWRGHGLMCNSFTEATEPCDDIEIGIRGNLTEITGNHNGFYGWLQNSFVRINAHDNGDGTVYPHNFYLSSGPQNTPNRNVVFEDGIYSRSSVMDGRSIGTFLNISGQNADIVVRNNLFEDPDCATWVIDCSSGSEDPEEFCDGFEIYDNAFKLDCPVILNLASTQRARVYNNLFVTNGVILDYYAQERAAADGWFFNNTVVCGENCDTTLKFEGDDNRVFNNLFQVSNAIEIVEGGSGACTRFGGSGGPNFNNNFLHDPNGSGGLPACGSANSMTVDAPPGFVQPDAADFHITNASAVAGFGSPTGAPDADLDGAPRPNPPSAGAYDVQ